MTQRFLILGFPVSHSRSPAMHNAAFAELGIDAVYERCEVRPDQLAEVVRELRKRGVEGANVTVPHKSSILPLLDGLTPSARAIGAVNTLQRNGERWVGHNTDAAGLARSLEEAGVNLMGARVVVLGAGGAARASVVGLAEHGAAEIVIAARRREQAVALAGELAHACGACSLSACELNQADLSHAFASASLLVQATSATLDPAIAEEFANGLPLDALPAGASVVDLVYKPRETSLLVRARRQGLHCIDGLGMLLHQGALAFELWTGRAAPLQVMRAALEAP